MSKPLLPIKVVFPSAVDYQKPENIGRLFDPVQPVTAAFRQKLSGRVNETRSEFGPAFAKWQDLPAVATVVLNKSARTKSHRPSEIFNDETCPIIGTRGTSELLVSVTPRSLELLQARLAVTTKKATAHISTIDDIHPFRPEISAGELSGPLRVRLARHSSERVNEAIDREFEKLVRNSVAAARAEILDYSPGLRIYSVAGLTPAAIQTLKTEFVNLQSVSPFPFYSVVRTSASALRPMTDDFFSAAQPGADYGVVGLIDSGTDPGNDALQSWVLTRDDSWTPRAVQDNSHGTFVAGLITNARKLNHGDQRFPDCAAKIVDVVAFDRDGRINEQDLLLVIDGAVAKYPEVKVWNLSLALNGPACGESEVSDLAAALDARSERNGVLFVVAAGNISGPSLRAWPLTGVEVDDRIRPPADAVRALTVGGLAHVDTANTMARRECPSPFSRSGPGVAGTMKPEVTHYAGNVDAGGGYIQSGIMSLHGGGFVGENVGTSFSAPLVSAVAAATLHELETPAATPSILQLRAMLLHSAFVQNTPYDPTLLRYCGVGKPGGPQEILNCVQTAATVIMNVKVSPEQLFEKDPFPIPKCLVKAGRIKAEMFMTMLADCSVDKRFGVEYCRSKVTASLGTLHPTRKTKTGEPEYSRQLAPAMGQVDSEEEDSDDVRKQGSRWAPARFYYRKFSSGPNHGWRLRIKAMNRAENLDQAPVNVSILLTLRSGIGTDAVYDEWVKQMQQLAWDVVDLPVKSRVRERNR